VKKSFIEENIVNKHTVDIVYQEPSISLQEIMPQYLFWGCLCANFCLLNHPLFSNGGQR
jgi:hypothetical protein